MTKIGVHLDWETFCCSICLDLLKDPVTTSCGHSFCMKCMNRTFDNEDDIYKCPHCREVFLRRPVLQKNVMLAALVEEMKRTGLQHSPADPRYAGPEEVACDVCTGRKLRARKFCLVCLVSYCEIHLQNHYDVAPLEKHMLAEPSEKLQVTVHPRRDEKWEIPPKTASEENEAKVGSSHSQAKKNLLKNPRESFWWDLKKVVAPGDPRNVPQMEVIVRETIHFRGHIVGGLHPGKKVSVIGIVDSHPDRFYVSLTCGYGTSGQDITNVALEICVLFSERQVRRRARVAGLWEDATRTLPFFPFIKGEAFKMEIFCERSRYRVFVDGEQLFDFKHRVMPLDGVDALWIKGSIVITKLS